MLDFKFFVKRFLYVSTLFVTNSGLCVGRPPKFIGLRNVIVGDLLSD